MNNVKSLLHEIVCLTDITVNLIIIDCVIRIVVAVEVAVSAAGVVIILILLNLRFLRDVVRVWRRRRLLNSVEINIRISLFKSSCEYTQQRLSNYGSH